jgi:hypothetical protein
MRRTCTRFRALEPNPSRREGDSSNIGIITFHDAITMFSLEFHLSVPRHENQDKKIQAPQKNARNLTFSGSGSVAKRLWAMPRGSYFIEHSLHSRDSKIANADRCVVFTALLEVPRSVLRSHRIFPFGSTITMQVTAAATPFHF